MDYPGADEYGHVPVDPEGKPMVSALQIFIVVDVAVGIAAILDTRKKSAVPGTRDVSTGCHHSCMDAGIGSQGNNCRGEKPDLDEISGFRVTGNPRTIISFGGSFPKIEGISEWAIYLSGSVLFMTSGIIILRLIFRDKLIPAFYMTIVLAVLVTTFGVRAVNWLPVYEGYRSPENFRNEKNVAVFALEELQPEVVWKLGRTVPVVSGEIVREYNQPFLLLVSKDHETDYLNLDTRGRTVEKVDSYDLNYFRKKNNRYRARYILDVYLFDHASPESEP